MDYQRRKSLNRNSIRYSKMRLCFKGRLLCSGLLCRSEVWGEVSGLRWEKRSRRGQGSWWSAGETQRTSAGTPDCKQGNKLIPSHKLAATWDCWLSEALRRLLEETPGFPGSPKQSQCLCKAHVSVGLGFCLLYRVELPWF